MARLLDLPPEIRVVIFKPLILSPTQCIEPISRIEAFRRGFPRSASSSSPIFYLAMRSDFEVSKPAESTHTEKVPEFVALSLLRVSRIIYLEISALFWTSHTFTFASPYALQTTFKGMGQIASRRITSLRLFISATDHSGPAFRSITKIAANGALQRLDLVLRKYELNRVVLVRLSTRYNGGQDTCHHPYCSFLRMLHDTSKLNIPKRLIILTEPTFDEYMLPHCGSTLEEMKQEWGDEIIFTYT